MSDWFTCDVEFINRSSDSIHVRNENDEEVWLPISLVETDEDLFELDGDELIQITIPVWLAEKKGMC